MEFKLFLYFVIVFSAVFHEYFHGLMAYFLGDPTAKYEGRLTLNPLRHMDPMGTVIIPICSLFFFGTFFGWAKPVPYNPHNLRDQKYGSAKVGAAGPMANFLIAIFFGLIVRISAMVNFLAIPEFLFISFTWIIYINIFLALFNLIPIPPLDGSKLLMDFFPRVRWSGAFQFLEHSVIGIFLAIALALMILPPLSSVIYFLIVGGPFSNLIF